jgi:toxin ParE1/3/4
MSRVVLAADVEVDLDRIFDFLFLRSPEYAAQRIQTIINAINILETSPLIGRPVAYGQRELVISTGASGFLALYRYDSIADVAYVLAIRSQREQDYKRPAGR